MLGAVFQAPAHNNSLRIPIAFPTPIAYPSVIEGPRAQEAYAKHALET